MNGFKVGISGLALAAAAALPHAANATASFNIGGNIRIELASPVALGEAEAVMVYQAFSPVAFGLSGDAGTSGGSTDFNGFFPTSPQDGDIFSTDLGQLGDFINVGRPTLGAFAVNFQGFANSQPGVGASLDAAGSDSFSLGTSGAQTYEFTSDLGTAFDLVISPVVLFNDLSADPGSSAAATGRYLIDDEFTQGLDYIVTVTGEPDGFGGVISSATLRVGGGSPMDMLINASNTVVNLDGSPITIPVAVFPDGANPWKFSFEAIGELRAAPGEIPSSDVPVPAALPLLATAMGGLFWMRRRKSA